MLFSLNFGVFGIQYRSVLVRVPVEEESRAVVLGAERLDVAVAPLEPSPSAVVTALTEE